MIIKVQKIEALVDRQALLVAMRELKKLKEEFTEEENLDKDLKNWVQGKIDQSQEAIINTFKIQRDQLVQSLEVQTEFDIGDSAFQEIKRYLKLLGK